MPTTEPTATTDAYRRVQLWANRIPPEGDSETPPEGGVRA